MGVQTTSHAQKVVMIFHEKPDAAMLERLLKHQPELEVVFYFGQSVPFEIPLDIIQDATILLTARHLPAPETAKDLKLVQSMSSGIEYALNHRIYTDTNIPLTNSAGIHGCQIAEWVVMTLLAHSHHLMGLWNWQQEHRWASSKELTPVRDLSGQRLGVLGYGSIGRQVARSCQAMGMEVIAYTASPRPTPESKTDSGFIVPGTGDPDGRIPTSWYSGTDKESLHAFLRQDIDVLVVCLPLTKWTTKLLGEAEFNILGRRQAFISNVSRGQILDQDALISAIKRGPKKGGLCGAALDVTDPEPLNKDSELWDLPNVFVTPHASGRSLSYIERVFQILAANLARLENGDPLINVVKRDTS